MLSSRSASPSKPPNKSLNQAKFPVKKFSDSCGQNSKPKSASSKLQCFNDSKVVRSAVKPLPLKFTNADKRKNDKEGTSFQKDDKTESQSCKRKRLNLSPLSKPKTYVCKFCCRQFHTGEQLQQHAKIHNNKSSYICYLCNYQTVSFSALMNHFLKHSGSNDNTFKKTPDKSKRDDPSIQVNASSAKQLLYCGKCRLSFNVKSKLDAHKCPVGLLESAKKMFKCTYCGRTSSSFEEYRTCVQSHTETPFFCLKCKAKFQRKKQLDLHLQSCKAKLAPNKSFKCNKCLNFRCKDRKELEIHLKKCKIYAENFSCKNCDFEISDEESFEEHLDHCKPASLKEKSVGKVEISPKKTRKYVRKKVKYSCSSCKAPFFVKSEYVRHEKSCVKVVSYDANESVSKSCSKCGSMILIGKFAEHAKTCSGKILEKTNTPKNKNDSCSDNGEDLKNASPVKKESDIHHLKKDSNYESKSIKKEKEIAPDLEDSADEDVDVAHKNTDIGDNVGSRRSTRLVRRKSSFFDDDNDEEDVERKKQKSMKIKVAQKPRVMIKPKFRRGKYTGESNRSFLCNICDFSFCSKSTLLRHKRMHSGNPWYTCKYCGKFFFRKDVYIRHEVNVHKENEKAIFCCCYCKLCYNDASALKEHVMEAHKDSAFLPIRPRIFSKKVMGKLEVKQESKDFVDDDASDLSESRLNGKVNGDNLASSLSNPFYQCSICPEKFESSSEILTHMSTHSGDLPNYGNSTNELKSSDHILTPKDSTSYSSKLPEASFCKTKSSQMNSAKLAESSGDKYTPSEKAESNSAVPELIADENMLLIDSGDNLECLLCKQKFSSKILLEAHSKTEHKIIEWYQCLECPASGSKQDMIEHMFSHMYKVGAFVVSCNSKNLDDILPCLELGKTSFTSNSNVSKTPSKAIESNVINSVSEIELPPLREYGICSCMTSTSEDLERKLFSNEVENYKNKDINVEENLDNISACDATLDETNPMQNDSNQVICTESIEEPTTQDVTVEEMQKFEKSDSLECVTENEENLVTDRLSAVSVDVKISKLEKESLPESRTLEKYNLPVQNDGTLKESPRTSENLSVLSSNEKLNDDVTDSFHVAQEKEENVVSLSDSSSSSEEKSIASVSDENETKVLEKQSSSEEDEIQTGSSSDDSSSETSETEDEDNNSSESSSSDEEDDSENTSVSSPAKNDTENSIMLSPTSLLEKEETEVGSTQFSAFENKNSFSEDALSNKFLLSPKLKELHLNTSNIHCSRDETSYANNSSVSKTYSDSEKKSSAPNLPFLLGKEEKTVELTKPTPVSSNIYQKEAHLCVSHLAEKVPESLIPPISQPVKSCENKNSSISSLDLNEVELNKFSASPFVKDSKEMEVNLLKDLYNEPNIDKNKEILPFDSLLPEETAFSIQETNLGSTSFSSQTNEMPLNLQKRETVIDYQPESYSQLRYLLQKPSKMDSEKITIYPLSYTDSSIPQGASTPYVKCFSNIDNQELFNSNFIFDNKCDFSMANSSSALSNKTRVDLQPPQVVKHNAIISHPAAEFHGNPVANAQNKPPEKIDNFFKPCSSQSPILDFSDLIQHSFENASPCDEDMFPYTEAVKTDHLHPCREEIRTPECTTSYDSSAFCMTTKCSGCGIVLENSHQMTNHKCLPFSSVNHADSLLPCKPQHTFQSIDFSGSNKVSSMFSHSYQGKLASTSCKATDTSGGCKASAAEIKRHSRAVPHQYPQMPPAGSPKCNKCHMAFSDISELMKHSLTCLKPLFYRNSHVNDCMTPISTFQPMQFKEPVPSFSQFPFSSPMPITTASPGSTTTYHQSFENIKHPFDS